MRLLADGYGIHEETGMLSRPFVPSSTVAVADQREASRAVAGGKLDPLRVAFVEGPSGMNQWGISGSARITRELPGGIQFECNLNTLGLVVLNDTWYPGWRTERGGQSTRVWHVNGALIGVAVPAGYTMLRLRYRPDSFRLGLTVMGLSLVLVTVWLAAARPQPDSMFASEKDVRHSG